MNESATTLVSQVRSALAEQRGVVTPTSQAETAALATLRAIREPPEAALRHAMNAIGGGDYRQSVLTKWQSLIDAIIRQQLL